MGINLFMLKIWVLLVKGLQSCRPLNFENDSTPGVLEPGPIVLAHTLAGMAKAADFFLRSPTLTASNFAALWPTDRKFSASKDLNIFWKCLKFQDAGSILIINFAQSNRPQFHRVYQVTVCKRSFAAVYIFFIFVKESFWNKKLKFVTGRNSVTHYV